MSFQAYLDNIKAKTGKTPEDFKKLAQEKGLMKPDMKAGEIIAWLKQEFELGHGHAMAIYASITDGKTLGKKGEEGVNEYFSGSKAGWRKDFDTILATLQKIGPVELSPSKAYVSLQKSGKKFAIIQATADRMDIGIKIKGKPAAGRFEDAAKWNPTVTHKVTVTNSKDIDKEVYSWLGEAYSKA